MTRASIPARQQTMKCEVCEGSGLYPVHDVYGTQLYSIDCPECGGDGLSLEGKAVKLAKDEKAAAVARLADRYRDAMINCGKWSEDHP